MNAELPTFHLTGRVALITGASKGLGYSAALALADAGADIVLGLRDSNSADELVNRITHMGRRVIVIPLDVMSLDQAESAMDKAFTDAGKVDILVNNVGGGIDSFALDVRPEDFDHTINLNVKSTFFISQYFARRLIAAKQSGCIVNLSSQAGLVALPGETTYCVAKAAVSHLTRCLAIEWGKYGIRVNAVCPTFIETPGTKEALADADFRQDTIERIEALKRIGQPVDVSGAIVFLASPAAEMVTGHNFVIDGGWTIR